MVATTVLEADVQYQLERLRMGLSEAARHSLLEMQFVLVAHIKELPQGDPAIIEVWKAVFSLVVLYKGKHD